MLNIDLHGNPLSFCLTHTHTRTHAPYTHKHARTIHTHTHAQCKAFSSEGPTSRQHSSRISVSFNKVFRQQSKGRRLSRKSTGRQEVNNPTVKQSPRQKYPNTEYHRVRSKIRQIVKITGRQSIVCHNILSKYDNTPGQPEVQSL